MSEGSGVVAYFEQGVKRYISYQRSVCHERIVKRGDYEVKSDWNEVISRSICDPS